MKTLALSTLIAFFLLALSSAPLKAPIPENLPRPHAAETTEAQDARHEKYRKGPQVRHQEIPVAQADRGASEVVSKGSGQNLEQCRQIIKALTQAHIHAAYAKKTHAFHLHMQNQLR